jgi:MFS transporter, FHS family, L-fucose permease
MSTSAHHRASLLWMTYFIYFFCGLALCFDRVFNPDFKIYFNLSYQQLMYTQPAFSVAGLLLAYLAGILAGRIGYKKSLTLAMLLFAVGNLIIYPALHWRNFYLLLASMFIMGAGFNIQLVSGNPLMIALGEAKTASSRLNLGNALGAVGQVITPLLVTQIFTSDSLTVEQKVPSIQKIFLTFAVVLFTVSFILSWIKDFKIQPEASENPRPDLAPLSAEKKSLWAHPHLLLGFLAIFLSIGAEAGMGGLYLNFLQDPKIAGLTSNQANWFFMINLLFFAIGRLTASWIQRKIKPERMLAIWVSISMGLMVVLLMAKGLAACWAITLLGFFICIFFPTLYSLAVEGLGELMPKASGLLIMGFSGTSIIPVVQGALADRIGLQPSFAIAFVPWLFVLFYAMKGHRIGQADRTKAAETVLNTK